MDDLNLVRRYAREVHQLPTHTLGIGQHLVGSSGQPALGDQVQGGDGPIAHRGHHDRDGSAACRQPSPEVGLVAIGLQDLGLLRPNHVHQTAEARPIHAIDPQNVARLAGRQILRVVNGVVKKAEHRFESRGQSGCQFQNLTFRTALLEVGNQKKDLVTVRHLRRSSTTGSGSGHDESV